MKASVFVGTSLDGFIARPDGAFDFLPTDGGEPHGYDEFMATVDALVMGRKTYETLKSRWVEFTEEPTERPYGIDCGLRDPFGNHIRIGEIY